MKFKSEYNILFDFELKYEFDVFFRPNQVPSVTMGSGKIFYQPDDADDFDEEDPDDDLDI